MDVDGGGQDDVVSDGPGQQLQNHNQANGIRPGSPSSSGGSNSSGGSISKSFFYHNLFIYLSYLKIHIFSCRELV